MNDLRTAAQQALEALGQSETTVQYEGFGMARREAERKHQAAIAALRAALAESERDWSLLEATQESLREHMTEVQQLRKALEFTAQHKSSDWPERCQQMVDQARAALAEPQGEMVAAWEDKYGMKEWEVHALRAGWRPAKEPDPCPQCEKGGVCRTPKCGRLKLPVDHQFRTAPQPKAEPQEPVAYWIPKAEQFCIAKPDGRPFAKAWQPLYAAPQPAKRVPQQEPVAWQWLDTANFRKKLPTRANKAEWNPLYTAPQPAKQSQEPSVQGVLLAVEEAIRNGDCPWQIEQAFDDYEAERMKDIKEGL